MNYGQCLLFHLIYCVLPILEEQYVYRISLRSPSIEFQLTTEFRCGHFQLKRGKNSWLAVCRSPCDIHQSFFSIYVFLVPTSRKLHLNYERSLSYDNNYISSAAYHASYPRAPLFALVLLRTCIAHVSTEEEGGAAPVRLLSGFMNMHPRGYVLI